MRSAAISRGSSALTRLSHILRPCIERFKAACQQTHSSIRQNWYFCPSKASKLRTCHSSSRGSVRYIMKRAWSLSDRATWSHTSAYVSIRQHTSAYVSTRQHTSAYVSIRQHTPAYVSIRQHTSAYVSIRQHTSAYVSAWSLSDRATGHAALQVSVFGTFVLVKQVN
jgi:hypothetical protein